jgi:hypothetical protein
MNHGDILRFGQAAQPPCRVTIDAVGQFGFRFGLFDIGVGGAIDNDFAGGGDVFDLSLIGDIRLG